MKKTGKRYKNDQIIQIPRHICEDVFKNGYAYIPLIDGSLRRITKEDFLFKKSEIEELSKKLKSDEIKIPDIKKDK